MNEGKPVSTVTTKKFAIDIHNNQKGMTGE